MRVSPVAKTIVAVLFAVVNAIVVATGNDFLDTTEIVTVVLSGLTALGVYVVPNSPANGTPTNRF